MREWACVIVTVYWKIIPSPSGFPHVSCGDCDDDDDYDAAVILDLMCAHSKKRERFFLLEKKKTKTRVWQHRSRKQSFLSLSFSLFFKNYFRLSLFLSRWYVWKLRKIFSSREKGNKKIRQCNIMSPSSSSVSHSQHKSKSIICFQPKKV